MLFIFKFNNQVDFASLSESTKAQYKNRVIAFPDYQPKAPEMLQHFHFPAQENIKQLPHAEFAKGAGKIGEVVWNNRDLSVNYSATKNSALKVNRFYIQGWQAEINGKPAAIKFEDKMGVMLIDAQKCSDCTLKIWLPMLPSEKLGYIISAISLFVFAASGFYSYRVRKLA
jgi:uncharacterized membrane protein YfhO